MIIIPVGIGGKVPRFPILTMTLSAATIVATIMYFSVIDSIEKSPELKKLDESRMRVVSTFCPTYGLSASQCTKVNQVLELRTGRFPISNFKDYLSLRNISPAAGLKEVKELKENFYDIGKYFFWMRNQMHKTNDADLLRSKSFQEFDETREDVKSWLSEGYPELLSSQSFNLKSIFLAQFIHGSWLHLIGNLLVFLAFGIFLEQRINSFMFLSVYFIGGSLGLASQLFYFPDPETTLLIGASANISAIMGAFYVLFFRSNMNCLFSVIVWNKVFRLPVAVTVPILYLAADVTGVLGGATDSIAHGAHLVGFGVGLIVGLLNLLLEPLSRDYLYPYERILHRKLRKSFDVDGKIKIAKTIFKYNPENMSVTSDVILSIYDDYNKMFLLQDIQRDFLNTHLIRFATVCGTTKRYKDLGLRVLEKTPLNFNFKTCLKGLDRGIIISFASEFLKREKWISLLRLYDLYLSTYPKSSQCKIIVETVEALLTKLMGVDKAKNDLRECYYGLSSDSRIRRLIDKHYNFEGEALAKRAS